MEEHSWEPKLSLFDWSNLVEPSKFWDIYFHGNLVHRKREWQIPGYEKALTSLPFVPLFASHQTVQNPIMLMGFYWLIIQLCIKLLQLMVQCLMFASNSDFDSLNSFLSMPKRQ